MSSGAESSSSLNGELKFLSTDERTRLVENIVGHLMEAQDFIQKRPVQNFSKVDAEFGQRVMDGRSLGKPGKDKTGANL
ncbi:catalase-like [Biomphalaria glabrata]|uniref:Catalase-like n=1 Tax=Biomphalaria glabrata TaxID=6526 RepID=A0A9W3AMK9_BIOGL|nr:catalase-like [Biomphalaria glabrata]